MSKKEKRFTCNVCGASFPKWIGKCEDCGQWNTVIEEVDINDFEKGEKIQFTGLTSINDDVDRKISQITEFDRVLGGGAVAGSVVLIGGDPGIGKSTLLLQVLSAFSKKYSCYYISGEESSQQICLRAARVGVSKSNVNLACETKVGSIIKSVDRNADFLVIDSIQTLQSASIESIPGTVTQVRACAYELIHFAKTNGITVFLVGHVTKDGAIAGPKVLEHMVDTVLYFEGEKGNSYRILRSVKNRYGPANELGIFEMQSEGLFGVTNPSMIFMTQRDESVIGTTVFPGIEGTRPLLVETQSLVSKTYFPSPRRTVVGWDINRLFAILAVIESKCKISFSDHDVYLSIAGGLKITEPAGDLAVALSLLSSRKSIFLENGICAFGEIGLTGEIRSVAKCSERIKEAKKLGFKKIIIPKSNLSASKIIDDVEIIPVGKIKDIVNFLNING